jgi:hypothetical protein
MLALATAIRMRGDEIYAAEQNAPIADLADAKDLCRALSRLLAGGSIASAFGAPGEWGYDSAIGKALFAVYGARRTTERITDPSAEQTEVSLPAAERTENAPPPDFSSALQHFNEPWGVAHSEVREGYDARVVDRNGLTIADLSLSDVGESVETMFAARIRLAVNFCAGLSTLQLRQVLEKYGLRGFALMAYPAEIFPLGVLAAIRAFLDEAARKVAEQALALPCAARTEQAAQPENQAVGMDPDAHLGAVESCEAPVCPCDGTSGCEKGGQS